MYSVGMARTPGALLIEKTGLSVTRFAEETGISIKSGYNLRNGQHCGAVIWRRLSARWAPEIRVLGLTAEDFLCGAVVPQRAPGRVGSERAAG